MAVVLPENIRNGYSEVIGLGKSNIPLCRFLSSHGVTKITGRDRKPREALGDLADELEALGVTLVTGEGYLDGIGKGHEAETVIFRSPGLRPDIPQIAETVKKGAFLSSEMELFLELAADKKVTTIGITGSDGKTTSTTLTSLFLKSSRPEWRRVFVGGNIGEPLLPHIDEMTDRDYAVIELSSFQLMTMKIGTRRAAITNIAPNHLDWHTDLSEYARAKKNIFSPPASWLVVNAENDFSRQAGIEFAAETGHHTVFFSSKRSGLSEITGGIERASAIFIRDGKIVWEDTPNKVQELLDVSEIRLPGVHNIENYMTAMALTIGEAANRTFLKVAREFTGVPHRLEPVREKDGVRFFNSSIDSSPTRTAAALSAFGEEKVIIICGGYDKHIPFEPLALSLCAHAKKVVLTGNTAGKIKEAILACPDYRDGLFELIERSGFEEAVLAAANVAESGDVVLLSPACASFDAFKNFEERGERFREIINSL